MAGTRDSRRPSGTVAVLPLLEKQGVYQQLVHEYEKTSWVRTIGRGAYAKAGDKVAWTGGLYAIQEQMGLAIHAGGKAALQMQGYAHFLPMGKGTTISLFAGMPIEELAYEDLIAARERAVEILKKDLTDHEKTFLVSVKSGQPNWEVMGIDGIENLPAIRWKLANIRKIGAKKRAELLEKLKEHSGYKACDTFPHPRFYPLTEEGTEREIGNFHVSGIPETC